LQEGFFPRKEIAGQQPPPEGESSRSGDVLLHLIDKEAENMMPNMPNMMPGMDPYTLFWVTVGVPLCLSLVVTCIWLVMRWLKHRRTLALPYIPQPKDASQDYQQGYQPQQPSPETSEEGEQSYPYPLYEQPQAQHPETMPLQH
jgi:hypothetical protein